MHVGGRCLGELDKLYRSGVLEGLHVLMAHRPGRIRVHLRRPVAVGRGGGVFADYEGVTGMGACAACLLSQSVAAPSVGA